MARVIRPLAALFAVLLLPSCFTFVRTGETRIVTTADLGVVRKTATDNDRGSLLGGLTGGVNSDHSQGNEIAQNMPGLIKTDDVLIQGAVTHSAGASEFWRGVRGVSRVRGAVKTALGLFDLGKAQIDRDAADDAAGAMTRQREIDADAAVRMAEIEGANAAAN